MGYEVRRVLNVNSSSSSNSSNSSNSKVQNTSTNMATVRWYAGSAGGPFDGTMTTTTTTTTSPGDQLLAIMVGNGTDPMDDELMLDGGCPKPDDTLYPSMIGIDLAVPQWEAIGTALVLTLIIIITIVGNILVILSVFTYKPLRIVQNFFIVSLAVADLTVAILVLPLNVAYSLLGRWEFGIHVCKMWLTSDVLCCTASILNLCAIALDRYWAITDPINYAQKRTLERVLALIAGVWVLSLLISSPPLIGWNDWPDEFSSEFPCQLTSNQGYVIYSSLGSFFIPLAIMTIVYIEIYIATRRRLRERAQASKINTLASRSIGMVTTGAGAGNAGASVTADKDSKHQHHHHHQQQQHAHHQHHPQADQESISSETNNHNEHTSVGPPPTDGCIETMTNRSKSRSKVSRFGAYVGRALGRGGGGGGGRGRTGSSSSSSGNNNNSSNSNRKHRKQIGDTQSGGGGCGGTGIAADASTAGRLLTMHPHEEDSVTDNPDNSGSGESAKILVEPHQQPAADEQPPGAPATMASNCDTPAAGSDLEAGPAVTAVKNGTNARTVVVGFAESTTELGPGAASTTDRERDRDRDRDRDRNRGPRAVGRLKQSFRKPGGINQFIEEKQKISLSKERRAARTLGIIMGVFVVCWLPFFLMYVILPFCPSCCPTNKLINFITWLGYINSALNPIIYTIFNLDYRRAFKRLLGIKQ